MRRLPAVAFLILYAMAAPAAAAQDVEVAVEFTAERPILVRPFVPPRAFYWQDERAEIYFAPPSATADRRVAGLTFWAWAGAACGAMAADSVTTSRGLARCPECEEGGLLGRAALGRRPTDRGLAIYTASECAGWTTAGYFLRRWFVRNPDPGSSRPMLEAELATAVWFGAPIGWHTAAAVKNSRLARDRKEQ